MDAGPADRLPSSLEPLQWAAYELHDGLLQWVVAARLNLDAALASLEIGQTVEPGTVERLQHSLQLLETALEDGRQLIATFTGDTQPGAGDWVEMIAGFLESVQLQFAQAEQTVEFEPATPPWPAVAPRTQWNLLRILQQAVHNVIQHAGACQCHIRCGWRDPRTLHLQVVDDGRGMATESPEEDGPRTHLGVIAMQHRAKLIGAELHCGNRDTGGWSVELLLPIKQDAGG